MADAQDMSIPAWSRRLDEASPIQPGFPHEFIASPSEFVYGPASASIIPPLF